MTFVRLHRARSDRDLETLMTSQWRVLCAIEATRQRCGLSVEAFARLAGVSQRSYYRALSGLIVVRSATLAKLRTAQRKAAAEAAA